MMKRLVGKNILITAAGQGIGRSTAELLRHGCISGMVGNLIYYADTHNFFDRHYSEIQQLRTEFEDETGCPLAFDGDLKNFLAWFAFEETARKIADELGLE